MTAIDLTAEMTPIYWALIAVLVLSAGALVAMIERHPDDHHADVILPERLFASEALALAAGVTLFAAAVSTMRW